MEHDLDTSRIPG